MANSAYPITKPLYLYQGDDWRHEFTHEYAAADVTTRGFAVANKAGATPFYVLNHTDNSGQLVSANNQLTVLIGASDTAVFQPGTYFYDAELTVDGTVITIARGSFTVEGQAFEGEGGGWGFDTVGSLPDRLIASTLSQAWSYDSITRDVDGVITTATVRWPDNTVGTLTRTAKNETWDIMTAFTVTYGAFTVTQAAITLGANGNMTARPRPTVA